MVAGLIGRWINSGDGCQNTAGGSYHGGCDNGGVGIDTGDGLATGRGNYADVMLARSMLIVVLSVTMALIRSSRVAVAGMNGSGDDLPADTTNGDG